MSAITVNHLNKTYKSYRKDPGFFGSVRSLVKRKYENIPAVKDISFTIESGELVGFIGPNGAGKTTTLKCLSGLLFPTSGEISVLGFKPFERKNEFLKQISLVMGQKNQLWWDLPPMETFLLNKEIYQIPKNHFKKTLDELISILEVEDIINIQVRKLSLGQRMKCELIAALLHSPKILFLDEPTIGLDVVMQKKLRGFVREYNKKFNATIILTSHYMEDVRQLCDRIIVIDHGSILFDGKFDELVKKHTQQKIISVIFEKEVLREKLLKLGIIKDFDLPKVVLLVKRENANSVAEKLLKDFSVLDMNIEEPDIEDVIRNVFSKS